jgi:cytochrome bd-type quinol oxidase subunit 2
MAPEIIILIVILISLILYAVMGGADFGEPELATRWRRRSLIAGTLVGAFAMILND